MRKTGFTLIELMITVAVIGVLAAIAYPSYQDYVKRGRRADAMGELQQAVAAMERYFTVNGSYTGATAGATGTIPNRLPRTGTKHYDISLTLTPASDPRTGFVIRATPASGSPQAKDGMFDIDHTGRKRWDENHDGSFGGGTEDNWEKN